MSYCSFTLKVIGDVPHAICTACGRPYPTEDADPAGHVRRCVAKGFDPKKASQAKAGKLECVHRGLAMRAERCEDCNGGLVRIQVLSCGLRGECTVQKQVGETPCCATCGEIRAPG